MKPETLSTADLDRLAAEAHDKAVQATKIPRWVWPAYGVFIVLFLLAGWQI